MSFEMWVDAGFQDIWMDRAASTEVLASIQAACYLRAKAGPNQRSVHTRRSDEEKPVPYFSSGHWLNSLTINSLQHERRRR